MVAADTPARRAPLASGGWLWALPMALALAALAALLVTAMAGLGTHLSASALTRLLSDPYVGRVAWFSVFQAGLSAAISVALAIPFARTAARRADWRVVRALFALGNLAFVTPVIIGVFGVVQVHGQAGWISRAADFVGLDTGNYLYGLTGILLAHAFFNMPFAARIFARAIVATPPETWRVAEQLGMTQWQRFRLIEWPTIRGVLFPAAAVIFALCFTSFAVVLTLGGGPRATILEVAIYQALRFEFDIERAVALSLVQIVLAGAIALAIGAFGRTIPVEPASGLVPVRSGRTGLGTRIGDIASIALALFVFALPLAGALLPAAGALTVERVAEPALWRAAGFSITLAVVAGAVSVLLTLGLALGIRELRHRRARPHSAAALEAAGAVILVTPPVLLGAGLFLSLRAHANVFDLAPLLVVLVNAVSVLPIAMRIAGPDIARTAPLHDRLAVSLGIGGWSRWRLIDWPVARPAIGTAFGVGAAMAIGDLGVIALFGTPDFTTLPLFIYQRMGAYRSDDAAIGVMLLMILALILLVGLERFLAGGRRDA